jgi:hypothetical protein
MGEYAPDDGPPQPPVAAQRAQGRSEPTADHEASASPGSTDPEPEALTSAAEADSPQPSTNGHAVVGSAPTIGGAAATGTVGRRTIPDHRSAQLPTAADGEGGTVS